MAQLSADLIQSLHFFLLHGFQILENQRATRDLNRVNQALEGNAASLSTFATDWSHWTDAHQFMEGKILISSQTTSKCLHL